MQSYPGYQYISADNSNAGHAQRVFALKYHPETNYILVTGGWDNHLKVWDTRTTEGVVRTIHGPHICGDGLDLKVIIACPPILIGIRTLPIWCGKLWF